MRLPITSSVLVLIGFLAVVEQPAQALAQGKPAALSSASLSDIQQRAEAGDAQAQFEFGRAYEDGKGLPQDDAKAVEWFRKSAEQGNAQAENSLGVMYALGRGITRDREEAVRWYKKAAKQGSAEGLYNVAISYYNGEGVDASMSKACTWMMAAQRKGDKQAEEALKHIQQEISSRFDRCKFDLAALYEKGDEFEQDLPAAVALYMEAAQQEHKQNLFADSAQYKMCQLYIAGKGVPQDYAQAKTWCKKSEVPFAYVVLGRMAERGLGQEKNTQEALEFYRDAAILGVPDGYMDSGRLRLQSGSHERMKDAYFWYGIAARYKFSGAADKLNEVAALLNEKEVAEASKQVADWLKMPSPKRTAELKKH
jgi:TPR repeat protein